MDQWLGITVYSDREITEVSLPASEGTFLIHPEQCLFKCEWGIDLGALCYRDRSREKRKRGMGRKVALDSFDNVRAASVHGLANKILRESAARRMSAFTIQGRGYSLIKFVDWCDANGWFAVLEDIDECRLALKGYISHLRELDAMRKVSNESVHTWQTNLMLILNLHFDCTNVSLGVNLIARDRGQISLTEPPTPERLAKFLSFHEALFEGLCNLVLDDGCFPYSVEMPPFVGYDNNLMWLFPAAAGWARHPQSPLKGSLCKAYDYSNGRIRSVDECVQHYSARKSAEQSIDKTLAVIARANGDMRASSRLRFGAIANLAFCRIFEAVSAANFADIVRIEWTADIVAQIDRPATARQGFRSIKARANNRDVSYEVGVRYFPMLRKFCRLRAWLLNGTPFNYMFFHCVVPDARAQAEFVPLASIHLQNVECAFETMYPAFKSIKLGNRKTRAAKQDYVIRNYDPAIGAQIMQHKLPTALRNYSNGSAESAQEEMGDFLRQVHAVVLEGRHTTPIEEARGAGGCVSKNNPCSVLPDPPVQPDCKRSEGCVFCDKYRVHADETDVRKLLSARFVVERTAALAINAEEYDRVFGGTMTQIDRLLSEICSVLPSMNDTIQRISKEVSRGMLDSYWSIKLGELIEAGIL